MKKIAICMSLLIGQAWALSCTTPVTLSEAGQEVSTVKIAIDEKGEALALWVSKNPENKKQTLFVATRDGEKKWLTAALSEPVKGVTLHDFYIDAQGSQFACWKIKKKDSEGDKLEYYQFAKKEKNQTWSTTVNVLNPVDKLKYPEMNFASQGNILFVGHAETKDLNGSTNHSNVSVFYNHQNGEINKTEIAKTSVYPSSHLIKNRKGKVFAWWEESRSSYDQIKGFQSEKLLIESWLQDNGSWSTPTTFFSFSGSPTLLREKGIMNSKGDLALIWKKSASDGAETIQAITCVDGKWSEPMDFPISENYFADLVIAMNNEGHMVASWQRAEKNKEVVYVVDKPVDQPWSSPIALSTRMDPYSSAKISIDDHGNILAAWVVPEGRKEVPYAAYKPVNQEWEAPVRMSNGAQGCSDIKVETNHQGSFVVLWSEFQRKQLSIHGATLSTTTKEWSSARLSPEGQDCLSFKLAFNKEGQGVIAWLTTWDTEDFYVQAAELNLD